MILETQGGLLIIRADGFKGECSIICKNGLELNFFERDGKLFEVVGKESKELPTKSIAVE